MTYLHGFFQGLGVGCAATVLVIMIAVRMVMGKAGPK